MRLDFLNMDYIHIDEETIPDIIYNHHHHQVTNHDVYYLLVSIERVYYYQKYNNFHNLDERIALNFDYKVTY